MQLPDILRRRLLGLRGSVPMNLENLQALLRFNLGDNQLGGEKDDMDFITSLTNCSNLYFLGLADNRFSGVLPSSITNLSSQLTYLLLEQNQISGTIPSGIENLANLNYLTMDENIFTARYWVKKNSRKKPPSVSSIGEHFLEVTYAEILKATDDFSSANLIGMGSFGSVYKGVLDQIGLTVAIKVLKLQQRSASKSFIAECKTLKSIQHRNIVKILTVCSSIDFRGNDFKALVFEYMQNGSLDTWLHKDENEQHHLRCLNFIQRLNVAIDVANALDYLHHHCEDPVVHCDLKPSNILLNEDMVAHVGDFGLARVFYKDGGNCSQAQSSSVWIKGSIGYVAPEYGIGGEVSTYGDVYSYGILLLELFTGKRPIDDIFKDNLGLHHFAKMMFPERLIEIVDHRLLVDDNENNSSNEDYNKRRSRMHECLLSLVRIGTSLRRGTEVLSGWIGFTWLYSKPISTEPNPLGQCVSSFNGLFNVDLKSLVDQLNGNHPGQSLYMATLMEP
ncbi:hypothetical protein AAC387_Pa04g0999 [Persea americana]